MGFLCGYPNSCGVIRPPFQGSDVFAWQTQGAALGCDGSSRWDSKPRSSRTKNEERQFSVLGSRFSVLSSRFSVLGSLFSAFQLFSFQFSAFQLSTFYPLLL